MYRLAVTLLALAAVAGLLAFDLIGDVHWHQGPGVFVVLVVAGAVLLVANEVRVWPDRLA